MRISDWSSDVCSSDLLQTASTRLNPLVLYIAALLLEQALYCLLNARMLYHPKGPWRLMRHESHPYTVDFARAIVPPSASRDFPFLSKKLVSALRIVRYTAEAMLCDLASHLLRQCRNLAAVPSLTISFPFFAATACVL